MSKQSKNQDTTSDIGGEVDIVTDKEFKEVSLSNFIFFY